MPVLYRVYNKQAKPDDLAIQDFFSEITAQKKIDELGGQDHFAYETFTPRCSWGCLTSNHCPNEATWFHPDFESYGALCDDHYHPEAYIKAHLRPMLNWEEKLRQERGQQVRTPPRQGTLANFWFKERM